MDDPKGAAVAALMHELDALRKRMDAVVGSDDSDLTAEQLQTYTALQRDALRVKAQLNDARTQRESHFRLVRGDVDIDLSIAGPPHQFLFSTVILSSDARVDPAWAPKGDLPVRVIPKGEVFEILIGATARPVDELVSLRVVAGALTFNWVGGTKETFASADSDTSELEETVAAHVNAVKRRRIQMVDSLKALWALQRIAFDATNVEHTEWLESLWREFFPGAPFQRVSPMWKTVGFQGNDPTTDFRGTGVLGLHCLAYSVRVHRDAVLALARAERDYPWAAASINVVHVLFQKLCSGGAKVDIASLYHSSAELNTPLMTWCCRVSHPRPVEELFVITSALLDATFVSMKATYMDFNNVLKATGAALDALLALQPRSVDHLAQMVEQRRLLSQ